MIYGARDLRSLCSTLGVPVSFKGVSTYPDDGSPVKGLLDQPMNFKLADSGTAGVATEIPELRLPFNAFARMPKANDTIQVDGKFYRVSPPTAEDDGAFLCYELHHTL